MTSPTIQRLREIAKRRTPRKWTDLPSKDVFSAVISIGIATICMDCENEFDAEFIATAANYFDRLLDVVEAASKILPPVEGYAVTFVDENYTNLQLALKKMEAES